MNMKAPLLFKFKMIRKDSRSILQMLMICSAQLILQQDYPLIPLATQVSITDSASILSKFKMRLKG